MVVVIIDYYYHVLTQDKTVTRNTGSDLSIKVRTSLRPISKSIDLVRFPINNEHSTGAMPYSSKAGELFLLGILYTDALRNI